MSDRIGWNKPFDPRSRAHWLHFFGEDADRQLAELKDLLGGEPLSIERRPWGGLVVQNWENPFFPQERKGGLVAARRTTPAGKERRETAGAVLAAGVSADSGEGQALLARIERGEFGSPPAWAAEERKLVALADWWNARPARARKGAPFEAVLATPDGGGAVFGKAVTRIVNLKEPVVELPGDAAADLWLLWVGEARK